MLYLHTMYKLQTIQIYHKQSFRFQLEKLLAIPDTIGGLAGSALNIVTYCFWGRKLTQAARSSDNKRDVLLGENLCGT